MGSLLLIQFNSSHASRTFLEFESFHATIDGVCALYEKELKILNPNLSSIAYDIADLFSYLDQIADISVLMYQDNIHAYIPRNRDWLKKQLVTYLREKAN